MLILTLILLKPHAKTPGTLTWNPCTVMYTVSPTLALLGVMKSLGPLGAAEKQRKTHRRHKGHCTKQGKQILLDTCFVTEGETQIQFPVN